MSERKPIGLTTPYRKVDQQKSVEAQLAALEKKVLELTKRVKQLEQNK